MGEKRAFPGEGIEVRGRDDGVSVASGDGRLVIGNEEDDVGLFSCQSEPGEGEENEKGFHDAEWGLVERRWNVNPFYFGQG